MQFKVTYQANHDPADEVVEADEHVLEEKEWFVFKRYLAGHSLTPILRIKAAIVDRIEVQLPTI